MWTNKSVSICNVDSYRYEAVEMAFMELLISLGMPSENPFSSIVEPGDVVFIKPNWVASKWRESCQHKDSLYSVITHPTVIEVVADKVALALKGRGRIIIGDNPSIDADFDELLEFTGINSLKHKYDIPCDVLDLRPFVCEDLKFYGQKNKMVPHRGDPNGSEIVNLGKDSMLYNIDSTLFRGVFNEREDTMKAHTGDNQIYTYSGSLFNANVYISIPKMKTHHKVGATLNLKGLVGSILDKNQLVHWREGYPKIGGDEYCDKNSYEASKSTTVTNRGAWPGNDTIWRMVVDLYNGLQVKDRKYFSVVDGIIAGEGQGPFCPTSKFANTLIAGSDLLAVDLVTARYMGLDPGKIKYLKHFIDSYMINLDKITVRNNTNLIDNFFISDASYLDFHVPDEWMGLKIT